jgi:hypothetical protein
VDRLPIHRFDNSDVARARDIERRVHHVVDEQIRNRRDALGINDMISVESFDDVRRLGRARPFIEIDRGVLSGIGSIRLRGLLGCRAEFLV